MSDAVGVLYITISVHYSTKTIPQSQNTIRLYQFSVFVVFHHCFCDYTTMLSYYRQMRRTGLDCTWWVGTRSRYIVVLLPASIENFRASYTNQSKKRNIHN